MQEFVIVNIVSSANSVVVELLIKAPTLGILTTDLGFAVRFWGSDFFSPKIFDFKSTVRTLVG